eukprot:gene14828-4398_t
MPKNGEQAGPKCRKTAGTLNIGVEKPLQIRANGDNKHPDCRDREALASRYKAGLMPIMADTPNIGVESRCKAGPNCRENGAHPDIGVEVPQQSRAKMRPKPLQSKAKCRKTTDTLKNDRYPEYRGREATADQG